MEIGLIASGCGYNMTQMAVFNDGMDMKSCPGHRQHLQIATLKFVAWNPKMTKIPISDKEQSEAWSSHPHQYNGATKSEGLGPRYPRLSR